MTEEQERPDRSVDDRESARYVDEIEASLMGGHRTLRRRDVARQAGVSHEDTRLLWRALGFASPRDDDVMFSDADVEALHRVAELIADADVDHATALAMARAFGRSTDRLAMWQTQLIADFVSGDDGMGLDRHTALVTAQRVADLADALEPLLVYSWRRNLSVAVSRMVADSEPEGPVGVMRTVGFADLVSFTQLVRQLSERELAQLVLRFEALASDIVSAHGGALVKTVGDEVLFTHQEISGAVDIAFDLLDAAAADDLVPRMRVGMATGRVLARLGDIYGNTVNRAARLTAVARPGTVLADAQVAGAVQDRPWVRTAALDPIELQGIGEIVPWALQLRHPSEADEGDE
ncbi:adenylate/guanylate cyclase domain-containing protein [Luteipulveratus sp. YIM 133132]|uniref:adenylate/guanylate cyclase domain-containing protein n=1 Tax=Luteipulveratus flavus TaxID=3031728 RepID=UPI0023AF58D9|nr:adenylate/guanylate cyclase domain-containing protein [Luteipulveratus sp. YIM 133132]MDE9367008.1 adenylate/guanylate cyclase domain-containing protein [Luteipulveratus sp. YIM 133132]